MHALLVSSFQNEKKIAGKHELTEVGLQKVNKEVKVMDGSISLI